MNSANLKIRGMKGYDRNFKIFIVTQNRLILIKCNHPTQLRSCNVMTVCNSSCEQRVMISTSVCDFCSWGEGGMYGNMGDVSMARGACTVGGVCGKGGACVAEGVCMPRGHCMK